MSNNDAQAKTSSLRHVFSQTRIGLSAIWHAASLKMLLPAVVSALALAVAVCGPVGSVVVDAVRYEPLHVIGAGEQVVRLLLLLVALVLLCFWRGEAYDVLSGNSALGARRFLRRGLYCLQLTLLNLVCFGLPLLAVAALAMFVSLYFVLLLVVLACYLAVPMFFVSCLYMWDGLNYRQSLARGIVLGTRCYGRTLVFMLVVGVPALLASAIAALPGGIMKLVVYDSATAVAMRELSAVPWYLYVIEFVSLLLTFVLLIMVGFLARAALREHFLAAVLRDANRKKTRAEAVADFF